MKKTLFLALCFFLPLNLGSAASTPTLDLVWPPEGHHFWALHTSFIFGSVQPPSSHVTVNGQTISVYRTGAFLAMIPLTLGDFPIQIKADSDGNTAELVRHVVVDPPASPSPRDAAELDPDFYSPKDDVSLKPGDWLKVVFKGPPGGRASFKIGSGRYHPMGEVGPQEPSLPSGVYKGDYWLPLNASFDHAPIRFRLVTREGRTILGKAPAVLTVDDGAERRVCQVKDDSATVLTGPDKDLGYEAFLPKGVLCSVTGSWGKFLRLGFGHRLLGWVDSKSVVLLPEGTPAPHSILGSLTVRTAGGSSLIDIPLEAQQPFRVEQTLNPLKFTVSLYGVTADMDKVHFESADSCIRDVRWRQVDENLCELQITTNLKTSWGYDVRYVGNRMVFEIRPAPVLHPTWSHPLAGLSVALDAGHSSADPGATGPLRTHEDAINLLVARQLESKLESLGADIVMVRKNDENLDLLKRTQIAWAGRAQLYVSLHENSIVDSGNPELEGGYSIHYWSPESLPLAEAVHEAYQSSMPFKDGGVICNNLAVCRITEMPSILTESAFIIVPEQEAMLLDPAFRDKIAATIAQGIQQFLKRTLP